MLRLHRGNLSRRHFWQSLETIEGYEEDHHVVIFERARIPLNERIARNHAWSGNLLSRALFGSPADRFCFPIGSTGHLKETRVDSGLCGARRNSFPGGNTILVLSVPGLCRSIRFYGFVAGLTLVHLGID